jgi:ParB/RepB/Spo0J family partition protein
MKREVKQIPVKKIEIVSGFNPRRDFGDIEQLAKSITNSGLQNPLRVEKAAGNGGFLLVDGERRLRAIHLANETMAASISKVDAFMEEPKEEGEKLLSALISNDGLPLSTTEQGEAFKRLHKSGLSFQEIGERLGLSHETIRRRIALVENPEISRSVDEGELSPSDAETAAVTKDPQKREALLSKGKSKLKGKTNRATKNKDKLNRGDIKVLLENFHDFEDYHGNNLSEDPHLIGFLAACDFFIHGSIRDHQVKKLGFSEERIKQFAEKIRKEEKEEREKAANEKKEKRAAAQTAAARSAKTGNKRKTFKMEYGQLKKDS